MQPNKPKQPNTTS